MDLKTKILQLKSLLRSVEVEVDTKASEDEVNAAIAEIDLSTKQDVLVSGTNIKTINDESILGSGNISVGGGTFSGDMDDIPNGATYVKTENNLTDALKTAYDGAVAHSDTVHAPANAEQNVNADWNSNSGDSQILNKSTAYAMMVVLG